MCQHRTCIPTGTRVSFPETGQPFINTLPAELLALLVVVSAGSERARSSLRFHPLWISRRHMANFHNFQFTHSHSKFFHINSLGKSFYVLRELCFKKQNKQLFPELWITRYRGTRVPGLPGTPGTRDSAKPGNPRNPSKPGTGEPQEPGKQDPVSREPKGTRKREPGKREPGNRGDPGTRGNPGNRRGAWEPGTRGPGGTREPGHREPGGTREPGHREPGNREPGNPGTV